MALRRLVILATCHLLMVVVVMLSPALRCNFLEEKMVANVAASQIRFGLLVCFRGVHSGNR